MGAAFAHILLPFLILFVVLFAVIGFIFGRMITIWIYKKKTSKSIILPSLFLIFAIFAQFITLSSVEPLAHAFSNSFFAIVLFAISVLGKVFLYVFVFCALLGAAGYIIGKNIKKH